MTVRRRQPKDRALKLAPPSSVLLRKACTPVLYREHVMPLARQMLATVRAKGGVAIAAPQVGRTLRLVVTRDGLAAANPVFTPEGEEADKAFEGCLSFPGRVFEVERYVRGHLGGIEVLTGRIISAAVEGFEARMWQHEIDHLDGVVVADLDCEVPAAVSG